MDIEYITADSHVTTESWNYQGHEPGVTQNEPWLKFLMDLASNTSPAHTVSISYSENEKSVKTDFLDHCAAQFMKAGLRGITIVIGSGDWGSQGTDAGVFRGVCVYVCVCVC